MADKYISARVQIALEKWQEIHFIPSLQKDRALSPVFFQLQKEESPSAAGAVQKRASRRWRSGEADLPSKPEPGTARGHIRDWLSALRKNPLCQKRHERALYRYRDFCIINSNSKLLAFSKT